MGAPFKPAIAKRFSKMSQVFLDMVQSHGLQWVNLQETFKDRHRDVYLVAPWQQTHAHFAAGLKTGWHLHGSGLTTLSCFPIVETLFRPFHQGAWVDAFVQKGVLLTRIALSSDLTVDVYNSHTQASYISQHRRSACRISQVQELLSFIIETHNPDHPVLLTGDLNIEEYNQEYGMLTSNGEFEFIDVMRGLYPDHVKHPLRTLIKKNIKAERKLDHVLFYGGDNWRWDVSESQIELLDLGLSDHRAVLCTVVFEKI